VFSNLKEALNVKKEQMMNKQAMIQRVAYQKIAEMKKQARIKKQAHFLSGIQKKLTALFMKEADQRVQEELKSQSRASKAGLAWAAKETGLNSLDDIVDLAKKGAKPDLKDPIQKLIYERTNGMKDPVEVANLVGELSLAYKNQDVGEMAKVLKVDEEVIALVLLWYTRSKTADDYDWGEHRIRKIDKGTEKLLNLSAKTLKVVSFLTGGNAIEWIVKLLPKGSLIGKPLKWGWWTILLVNRWTILSSIYSFAAANISTLVGWMMSGAGGAFLEFVAVGLHLYTTPIWLILFATIALSELFHVGKAEREWSVKNPFTSLFLVPVKSIFAILKQVFTGAVKVGKAIIAELKEYILENSGVLKSAFPNLSSWLSESRAFSPREQDQLAVV